MRNKTDHANLDAEVQAAEASRQAGRGSYAMRNTPHQCDVDAEAEAAETRRQGTELIQQHLHAHLRNNPDSSYVSWIATLHPENAEVTIDERFFVSSNPWWTVYEGAKYDLPIANAVPVEEERVESAEAVAAFTYRPGTAADTKQNTPNVDSSTHKKDSHCTPIDAFMGFVLSLVATCTVFALELAGLLIYKLAAGFWSISKHAGPLSPILMLIYCCLASVDSALLLASVLTSEIVAGVCYLLSLLFAGCDKAAQWHQYIRRTCHILRWAFRSESDAPTRHVWSCCFPKEDGQGDEVDKVDSPVGN